MSLTMLIVRTSLNLYPSWPNRVHVYLMNDRYRFNLVNELGKVNYDLLMQRDLGALQKVEIGCCPGFI
jgi:hypothetical protein